MIIAFRSVWRNHWLNYILVGMNSSLVGTNYLYLLNPVGRNIFLSYMFSGGSRAAATSKMERFVIIVNGFQPLTIITKRSILDVVAALDPPLLAIKTHPLNNWCLIEQLQQQCGEMKWITLQTHHVDSTLKRRGNSRFHVVSTWNPRGVFVGKVFTFNLSTWQQGLMTFISCSKLH